MILTDLRGPLHRCLNPRRARTPLSGDGAALHGGRFNPRGMPALHLSLTIETAVREANRIGALQPAVIVGFEADLSGLLDARDPAACAAAGVDPASLADPGWRAAMTSRGEAGCQALARRLHGSGVVGMIVPSFARGAGPGDANLVLWIWGPAPPACLRVVDDEDRLARLLPAR